MTKFRSGYEGHLSSGSTVPRCNVSVSLIYYLGLHLYCLTPVLTASGVMVRGVKLADCPISCAS